MNFFKHALVDHYNNTINSIDINAEILMNNTKKKFKINDDRLNLIQVVNSIQKFNMCELNLRNEPLITKFCFHIPKSILLGNLVIINRYKNDQSIEKISCFTPDKKCIFDILLVELIKIKSDDLVIDLSKPENNYLKILKVDGHNLVKRFCHKILIEMKNIINLNKVTRLDLRNVLFEADCYFLSNFSGLETLCIQSSDINFPIKVKNLMNLVKIDLSFNKIKNISFENLINLKILNLNGNLLEKIDEKMFQDLRKLEEIYLKFNRIKFISKNSFKDLESLRKLDISQNGEIKFDCNFRNLNKLLFLNLGQNLINTIEINGLEKLEYLNLGSAKIIKLNSLNELKFLEIESDLVPDISKFPNLNILIIKNVKYFSLDKNLKNLKFLIIKVDKSTNLTKAVDLHNINHLTELTNIKIHSSIQFSSFDIKEYFAKYLNNFDQASIDMNELNGELKILINMVKF